MDSQAGEYGSLSLLRATTAEVVSVFPFDEPEITFGRDMSCSVRLYYPQVSPLHCKIVFEERKAYMIVLGSSGIIIDGCKVYPSNSDHPRTIPLSNGADIEIHTKIFRFAYPPKDVRAAILAREATGTPAPIKRRAVRMSMIQSAIVFSPRPSPDATENLRVLRSPLKPGAVPAGADDDDEQEIVLVDGKYPRVVEEDKDLVIMEDVDIPQRTVAWAASPRREPVYHSPAPAPVTPRRKPRPSLHRAVLIRSAQRLAQRMEEEQEEDEKEVLETIAGDVEEEDEEGYGDQQQQPFNERDDYNDNEDEDVEMEIYEEQQVAVADEKEESTSRNTWRKSLEAVKGLAWPFRGSSKPEEEVADDEERDITEAHRDMPYDVNEDDNEEEEEEFRYVDASAQAGSSSQTPTRAPALGAFMTPQISQEPSRLAPRHSMGGARRVLVDQPWKIKDIVIPEEERPAPVKREEPAATETPGRVGRPRISSEERKAILERRRSAVNTSEFILGGLTPGSRRLSTFTSTVPMTPMGSLTAARDKSPTKVADVPSDIETSSVEEMDTRSLLERMKETVEVMKSRRSIVPPDVAHRARMSMSPTKAGSYSLPDKVDEEDEEEDPMEVDGDHGKSVDEVAVLMEAHSDEEEEPHRSPMAAAPATPVRGLFASPPPAVEPLVVPAVEIQIEAPEASTSRVADKPVAPTSAPTKVPGPTRMRVPRSIKTKAAVAPIEDSPMADDEATPPVRRGRSRTVEVEKAVPAVPKLRIMRGKKPAPEKIDEVPEPKTSRTRKAKNDEEVMSEATPAPTVKPIKRPVSKAKAKPAVVEPEPEVEEVPPPARRGRKPASSAIESVVEEASTFAPAAKTVRKTRIPKATASIESDPEPTRKGRSVDTPAQQPPAAIPRRGKAKAAAIDVEDDDELEPLSDPKPKRATRSRTNTVESIKEEADVREKPTKATRSTIKRVVGTPSGSEDGHRQDKENTPGPGDEEEEPTAPVAKATRVKRAVKVKEEPEATSIPTRVTRTRSKK